MKNLFLAILLGTTAQVLVYFQLQMQFISAWAKQHPYVMAFLGIPASIMFIISTKKFYDFYEGQVWPGRLIGFSISITVFAILSKLVLGEQLTTKTLICVLLALLIILIQTLFK